MEVHARTWFTPRQKTELWERWKSGQCVADIARAPERRNKSGVYRVLDSGFIFWLCKEISYRLKILNH
jgi:hypothetical protein